MKRYFLLLPCLFFSMTGYGASDEIMVWNENDLKVLYFSCRDQMDTCKANKFINARDKRGRSFLHYAVLDLEIEMVGFLLENGFDVNARDRYNWTALHYVSVIGNPEFARLLVKNRADVNAQTVKGYSPLMIAIINKNEELVEFLKQQIRINKEVIEI